MEPGTDFDIVAVTMGEDTTKGWDMTTEVVTGPPSVKGDLVTLHQIGAKMKTYPNFTVIPVHQ